MPSISSYNSPLQQAEIDIQIAAPIANTKLTQTFVNQTDDIIEAVYNFPVPAQAVIMQVIVTINGDVFNGQIQPVAQAEESYEGGIEDGKRSVLVRDIGDGQHELRAGNLAPNDCLIIQITLAQLMQAQPGGYRYYLPTVIAPKYGHSDDFKGLSHKHSILAQYPFSGCLRVPDNVSVACLSHGLKKTDKRYQFSGSLDQDIVLTVDSNEKQPHIIQALQGDYPCGLAVLPPAANVRTSSIASIVVLVDCSGSMEGLSMQQTRAGLSALLTDLSDGSEVSLMCFGSSVMHVTKKPLTINANNRKVLLDYISNIEADMGGTEIWDALRAAKSQCKKHQKAPEIILLTDGQVWESTDFFNGLDMRQNDQARINTIGIGSAVSEDIVIRLAESTHGQWMLVHPNEPMDERICHFISQVSAPRVACLWEADNTEWQALPSSSSEVHGATGFVVYSPNATKQDILLNNKRLHTSTLTDELSLALQKLVGQQQVRALDETNAVKLSLKLGLVNQHTSFVMVHEQVVENADGLPTLAVVPQMVVDSSPQDLKIGELKLYASRSYDFETDDTSDTASTEYLELPKFLRRESAESSNNEKSMSTGLFKTLFSSNAPETELLVKVEKRLSRTLLRSKIPTLEQLIKWGLNTDIVELMRAYLVQYEISDPSVLIAQVLFWLNDEQNILSAASIEVLTDSITDSNLKETAFFNAFIDELDELEPSGVQAR